MRSKNHSITDEDIWLIEKNIHGAWVIWGVLGIRQYYYYTKKEAKALYLKEVSERLFRQQSVSSAR